MNSERDLIVPDEVVADPKAVEVLRAWVADGGLICALRPTTWRDAGSWGIVLSDAARHIANAFSDEFGDEPTATLEKIRAAFEYEMNSPTDSPKGHFVD